MLSTITNNGPISDRGGGRPEMAHSLMFALQPSAVATSSRLDQAWIMVVDFKCQTRGPSLKASSPHSPDDATISSVLSAIQLSLRRKFFDCHESGESGNPKEIHHAADE
jgi:hypothetical protein